VWDRLIGRVERGGELPRNATVTLCAPTGTVALLMDCDTTGCEPAIALKATKKLSYGGEMKLVIRAIEPALYQLGYALPAVNKILAQIETEGHVEGLVSEKHLPIFDTAFVTGPSKRTISYTGHLKMLAAMQPHLSMAMSKTVNLPHEASVEDVEQCFVDAWKMGIKNVALFRDGCKAAQAVYADRKEVEAPLGWGERRKLPLTRRSVTRKIDIGGTEVYAHVGLYEDGTPGELFFTANCGSTIDGLLDSVAIAVSHALQYGAPMEKLVEKYQGTKFAPDGWAAVGDQTRHFKSILDYTFTWIAHEFLQPEESPLHEAVKTAIEIVDQTDSSLDANKGELCQRCGNFMVPSGGRNCYLCHSCGSTSGGCG
jgi:ribonucleoside-diphosphate reductase alpha chain